MGSISPDEFSAMIAPFRVRLPPLLEDAILGAELQPDQVVQLYDAYPYLQERLAAKVITIYEGMQQDMQAQVVTAEGLLEEATQRVELGVTKLETHRVTREQFRQKKTAIPKEYARLSAEIQAAFEAKIRALTEEMTAALAELETRQGADLQQAETGFSEAQALVKESEALQKENKRIAADMAKSYQLAVENAHKVYERLEDLYARFPQFEPDEPPVPDAVPAGGPDETLAVAPVDEELPDWLRDVLADEPSVDRTTEEIVPEPAAQELSNQGFILIGTPVAAAFAPVTPEQRIDVGVPMSNAQEIPAFLRNRQVRREVPETPLSVPPVEPIAAHKTQPAIQIPQPQRLGIFQRVVKKAGDLLNTDL